MENYPIKSVTFGGFDKQDVVRYIEQAAQTAAAAQSELQKENELLSGKVESLNQELTAAKAGFAELSAKCEALEAELAKEIAARQALEPLKPLEAENARLKAEAESLRPDAQAYAQFRERIGAIECEARKRAADLEEATNAQLRQTVDLCCRLAKLYGLQTAENAQVNVDWGSIAWRGTREEITELFAACNLQSDGLEQLQENMDASLQKAIENSVLAGKVMRLILDAADLAEQ